MLSMTDLKSLAFRLKRGEMEKSLNYV